jgi:2-(1,2-epoxy-1,2-dihydrophenyl)acetyl-CoA isomerase
MTPDTATTFEIVESIATLTLNEGGRMNPLTPEVLRGCLDALQRVRDDTAIRALIIAANGKGFCAGADLAEFGRRAGEPGASMGNYVGELMETQGNPLMAGIRTLPVPVVCAVNGVAAGGGVGFALAADMVIAARSAYFYLPFAPALGLVPDMGASWILPRAVGRARALGLALTGNKLPAEKAAQWGLIWACVDDDQLQAEAMKLARQLAALPGHAIADTRALFDAAETHTLEQQLAMECGRQQELIERESFAEGLRAFLERRKPGFRGR